MIPIINYVIECKKYDNKYQFATSSSTMDWFLKSKAKTSQITESS